MTQEDKQLLLQDLCGRLPYGVKAQVLGWDEEKGEVEVPLKIYSINTDGYVYFETNDYDVNYLPIEDVRPYLRPMSSMTEDELQRYHELCDVDEAVGIGSSIEIIAVHDTPKSLDYLNSIHVDYRGLIPKGQAISTEIFNPYDN